MDLGAVRDVYALRPLSRALVSSLNPELTLTLADLAGDIAEIGYPAGTGPSARTGGAVSG
ncbi:hypothetical protein AB0D10_15740 [Kitasatospora sp. NPDC048545]|uniref:hypothetical protein n=1 Tax=Kitasatospora sp. NPDC048545 TaxID=3157208 RepID=UPI00340238EC